MQRAQPIAADELQMRAFWRQWHALIQGARQAEMPVYQAVAV
jgi:hypothetical protein